jgi:hypothetical protein
MDPIVCLGTLVADRQFPPLLWIAGLILLLSIVLGRFFCAYLCPMGASIDLTDHLLRAQRESRKRRLVEDQHGHTKPLYPCSAIQIQGAPFHPRSGYPGRLLCLHRFPFVAHHAVLRIDHLSGMRISRRCGPHRPAARRRPDGLDRHGLRRGQGAPIRPAMGDTHHLAVDLRRRPVGAPVLVPLPLPFGSRVGYLRQPRDHATAGIAGLHPMWIVRKDLPHAGCRGWQ